MSKQGKLNILYHRKAYVFMLAEPYMPIVASDLNKRDYVKGAGGDAFKNCVHQLSEDDHGLADALQILSLRMFS